MPIPHEGENIVPKKGLAELGSCLQLERVRVTALTPSRTSILSVSFSSLEKAGVQKNFVYVSLNVSRIDIQKKRKNSVPF